MARIVLWRPMYDPIGAEILSSAGHEVVVVDSSDPARLSAELGDAEALWVRTPEVVSSDVLDAGPELRVVSTSGFGTDNVDIAAATRRGIRVINHPGFGRVPVAEHTVMLMLAVSRRLVWADRAVRDSSAAAQYGDISLRELSGKTVGIVGLGTIGSEVARILRHGFNCEVVAYDPSVDRRVPLLVGARVASSLDELLPQVSYLCLFPGSAVDAPIGSAELGALPQGGIVINTSRGHALDLHALSVAIDREHIAGAGLDVVVPEPLPNDHPLLLNHHVVFTPHTAGLTRETSARVSRAAAERIVAALDRRPH